ncbi:glycoside hydrolase family 28 protein [Leeuwenhoekiella marinoflava]|uniref:Glycosyl hydrolase family 28 n=2 Tax=Leeuwenhoekiella marinoflava TaxID=988 RepID=A0A4Q0PLM4_9FLAO|nr:glycoside hydrolase family 28 protein [Leeuwenhoekiella marinoflava]RXG28259.1 glycosyl hydrolase family 28 [Leeuwenhoekiella marinoflava]SHF58125.1 Glycosyl hydrolases family 28 [Leeuwenhoekiella marinoflava DSM 3653]
MKKLFTAFLIFFMLINSSCKQKDSKPQNQKIALHTEEVNTPFGNFEVKSPVFKNTPQFLITDFGAEKGDKIKTTKAIAAAIDSANAIGAGTVIVPQGEWLTGKIHFKSNVNLHLEEGARLLFSEDPQDYLPAVLSTWEGMECYNYSPLIYAYECENIAITGKGTLKAKMDTWEVWFARPSGHMQNLKRLYEMASKDVPVEKRQMVNDSANFRPQFIQFNRCKNVLLEGVSIKDSPFWVIHPYLSSDVTIRNVNVFAHGHNNDGVDPEMSQNVLIEDCVFDQGDDAIAVKAGRNQDAWRLNTPVKNVVIRNCLVKNGHQLLAIGSELSGGVENVFMENCEVEPNAKLNHLLFIKTNERRGGYVKNIYMENIKAGRIDKGVLGVETDVLYQWRDLVPTYERRLTQIEDVYMTNVTATNVDFVSRILGDAEMPIKNIELKNVKVDSIRDQELIHENVTGFSRNE